jgi:hypothetical protein
MLSSREVFHVEHFLPNGECLGEVCCILPVFNYLELRNLRGFCALLQRMENSARRRQCTVCSRLAESERLASLALAMLRDTFSGPRCLTYLVAG